MSTTASPIETSPQSIPLDERSKALRRQVIRIFECSRRGHLGSTFSLIEIIRALYEQVMRYDPANPTWPERDRFILSKGHGCLAQYVMLADRGFIPEEALWSFCQAEGILGGHPDASKIPGVETSTGSLGHGLSVGVGMALAARLDGSDRRVFVVTGDGEINEGSIWEAALSAGQHKLDNLIVLIDYNKQQSYDDTAAIVDLEPLLDKWTAFGFAAAEVNGHDVDALAGLLKRTPLALGRPSAIVCHTVKGKGAAQAEGDLAWHHKSNLTDDDLAGLYAALETAPENDQ